jgi:hypothetical protein
MGGRRGGGDSGGEQDMASLYGQQGSGAMGMGEGMGGVGVGASGRGTVGTGMGMGMGPGGAGLGMAGGAGPVGGAGRMSMSGMAGASPGGGGGMMGPMSRGGNRPAGKPAGAPQKPAQRSNVEIVQIRFVDYTVEPEHTYQYRVKVVVKNPNYNRLDVINPEETNKDKTLSSVEWSEPTPLVFVPPDIEYYVLDRVRAREEARLQVHQWIPEMGDWQFSDFQIKPGDPIGSKVREYPLVGWDDPPKIKKTELDFSTQDLLLDVTGGDKPFLFEVDGSEFKFTERLPTEIFVIDRLGDLAVRNDDFDKHNVDRVDRVKYITEVREHAKANEDKEKDKKTTRPETGNREDFEGRSPPTRRESGGTN